MKMNYRNKKYNYFANGGNIFGINSVKDFNQSNITSGLGILGDGINNMFSKPQIPEVNTQAFQVQSNSKDAYMSEVGGYKALDNIHWKDLDTDGKASNIAGNALGSTAKGAMSGATFGGVPGAIVGGVFGGLTSIFGGTSKRRKLKRAARKINAEIDDNNATSLTNMLDKGNDLNRVSNWGAQANFAAFGGQFNGGNYNTGLMSFDNGGTHEMNPNGGIPISFDDEGNPNLVEENEVVWNDYVFSHRLKIQDKDLIEDMGLPLNINNKSFAEAATLLSKERSERPNDVISKSSMEVSLNKLRNFQEYIKSESDMDNNMQGNIFAKGGDLDVRQQLRDQTNQQQRLDNGTEFMVDPNMYNNYRNNELNLDVPVRRNENQLDNLDKYQAFINKFSGGKSPLTAEDFYEVSQEYGIPMDIMLAQAALESNFGTKGMGVKSKNIFNVGNNSDTGKVTNHDDWKSGLKTYAKLMKEKYATDPNNPFTEDFIINDFNRPDGGGHYAGGEKSYTAAVINLMNQIGVTQYPMTEEQQESLKGVTNKESLNINPPAEQKKDNRTIFEMINDKKADNDKVIKDMIGTDLEAVSNPNLIKAREAKSVNDFTIDPNIRKQAEANLKPQEEDKEGFDYNNLMRYAPVVTNLGLLASDIFSKPEVMDFADKYSIQNKVQPNFIGNKLTYNPLDSDYLLNKVRQQGGAGARNIMNTSGGNRSTAMAGILANNYNTQNSMGDAIFNMDRINDDKRHRVEEFNRGTNMFNSQMDMQAQQSNIQTNQFNAQLGKEQDIMNMQNRAARRNNIRSGIANIGQSIGNIGTENVDRRAVQNTSGGYDVFAQNMGEFFKRYNNQNQKAFGGTIYKKRLK